MQWLLIDGNSWFAADWYATQANPLPGCCDTFMYRLRTFAQFEFDRVAIAWDAPRSFRKELSDSYKTHRGAKPEEYYLALQKIKQMVAETGIESLEVPTFEGDDVLATLAQIAVDEGIRAVISSADKDLHQCLVADCVSQVISWRRTTPDRLDLKAVTARSMHQRYGVHPHQWVDYRVMVGDPSDGITGMPDIGPTAALKVMRACVELERFYQSPFSVPGLNDRQRRIILQHRDQVPVLRQLLTLRRDVPVPSRWLGGVAS
jgi:DNA polymerase I